MILGNVRRRHFGSSQKDPMMQSCQLGSEAFGSQNVFICPSGRSLQGSCIFRWRDCEARGHKVSEELKKLQRE